MGPKAQYRQSGQTPLTSPHPVSDTDAPNIAVGLGNDIAADDGVGIAAAKCVEARTRHKEDVAVVALPWAGFALLDILRGRRRAAIIDCLTTGRYPAGTIVRLDETDMAGSVRLNSFHDISYPTVMSLGRELGWEMPDLIAIWGIEAGVADVFSEDLSPPVAAAVAEVANEVIEYLTTPLDRRGI
ncbi:MAG: hydrogenase maturation protease [Acidimicrobiia bacterium]|nr:hydrogenase maturation protease [Acidimicrobiia bacterium]